MQTITVLGISGSLRRASYNTALLRAFGEVAPPEVSFSLFDAVDLPVFNVDLEDAGDPPAAIALREAIAGADAVLFATPEYNGGLAGSTKNIVDWASRGDAPLKAKPCAVIGGGGRFGTAHAQLMLRHTLNYMGCPLLPGQSLYVQRVSQAFDEGGNLDQPTRERLAKLGVILTEWTTRVGSGHA